MRKVHAQGFGLIGKDAGGMGVEVSHHCLYSGVGNGLGIAPGMPATALAANPSTIKMDDCAYSGTKYDSPALGECYMHQMHFNYNGKPSRGQTADRPCSARR